MSTFSNRPRFEGAQFSWRGSSPGVVRRERRGSGDG